MVCCITVVALIVRSNDLLIGGKVTNHYDTVLNVG
jgi:hypothetical protein